MGFQEIRVSWSLTPRIWDLNLPTIPLKGKDPILFENSCLKEPIYEVFDFYLKIIS